jgi:hypothetical protein
VPLREIMEHNDRKVRIRRACVLTVNADYGALSHVIGKPDIDFSLYGFIGDWFKCLALAAIRIEESDTWDWVECGHLSSFLTVVRQIPMSALDS